jgi:hypothetical protein
VEHELHEPQHGVKIQMTDPTDTTAPLSDEKSKLLQKITGKFLYYAWAMDPTMLVTLSALVSMQTKGTKLTMVDTIKFLYYCTTHPDANIWYKALDMILRVPLDSLYLSEASTCSCAGGLFYIWSTNIDNTKLNSAILTSMSIMKPILSSASEAEIGMLSEYCKNAIILQTTLHKMGWKQPAMLMQTDNSTACRIW